MIERNLTSGQYTICPPGVTVHTNCQVDEVALTSRSSSSSVIGCEKMSTERQLCNKQRYNNSNNKEIHSGDAWHHWNRAPSKVMGVVFTWV